MLKQLLHLDSVDGVQNYDPILKAYHTYNTNIKINKPISNIKEISLKSVEFPLFFNNIRSANLSNLFSFNFNSSPFNNIPINVTITYITISSLITALNTAISTAISSYAGFTFVLSVVNTNYIRITTNATQIILNKCLLINNILGFNTGTYTGSTITTNNFYCMNIDNYINLYITNLNSGSDTNANGRLLTFKIVLPSTNGQILFLGENSNFTQTISITDSFYVLSSLNIMILDRFGFPINGGNSNYSFTLGITYDIKTEKIKRFL